MLDTNLSEELIIRRLVEGRETPCEEMYLSSFLPDAPRPAAVLVPFLHTPLPGDSKPIWQILFTRRSDQLIEHRGQVAFPGGRSDPEDSSPEATALRETYEEIGIHAKDIQILGRLNNLITITNYCVTPVVGRIPWPYPLQLAKHEVSRVFMIPLFWLLNPNHREIRQREIPPKFTRSGRTEYHPVIYFQPYDGEVLWGVSGEIILRLINTLSGKI
jgi:8-oxo-dGTP pyrophosphatase MutT (NUDIX family)